MEVNLHLEELKQSTELSDVAAVLQSELKRRFRKYTDPHDPEHDALFLTATFLDPRNKLLLNPIQTESANIYLLKQLKDLSENGGSSSSSATASPDRPDSDEPPIKKFCLLSRLIQQ